MVKTLEKWVERNKMEVNVDKTKIMIFRNGGKIKKNKWIYKGEEIEIVNEFKYLGYWFTTRNCEGRQAKWMAAKAQKATNVTWGLMKRTGRNKMRDRMYLMNSIVMSGALYGVEVWGWGKNSQIERVQSRFCKMAMGVCICTPKYIWRKELGIWIINYIATERAMRYLRDILQMGDERWPKICLKEEVTGIVNNNPTKWGRKMIQTLKQLQIPELPKMIWEEKSLVEIGKVMEIGLTNLWEKELKDEWEAIIKSSYNKIYKDIAYTSGEEVRYWETGKEKEENKEVWARLDVAI